MITDNTAVGARFFDLARNAIIWRDKAFGHDGQGGLIGKNKEDTMKRHKWAGLTMLLPALMFVFGCNGRSLNDPDNRNSCTDFPPPLGQVWTYQVIGNGEMYSVTTEPMAEKIGKYAVYRECRTEDPPGLGNYYGCDPDHGKVWVASDSWDTSDPTKFNRHVFRTAIPVDLVPYGTEVGVVRQNTIGVGYQNRTVMEVLAYEDLTIPLGTFEKVQKIRVTCYDEGVVDNNMPPTYQWHDKEIGLIQELKVNSRHMAGIQLVDYIPANHNFYH